MHHKDFENLVDTLNLHINQQLPLRRMLEGLQKHEPFCHLRINDGEFNCMFRLRPETERNNCGHFYHGSLAIALLRVLADVQEHPDNVLLGSYWMTQGGKVEGLDEGATALVRHLGDRLPLLPWVGSDDLVKGLTTDWPYLIFDEIRRQAGEGKPTWLIGNNRIFDGRHMLGAYFLPIPRYNCWDDTKRVMDQCRERADTKDGTTFVWCCGMSKPWIWDVWRAYPSSTHLDAGHLFDACFGEYSRAYTRRRDRSEPVWKAYEDRFIPYCRGFIK